MGTNEPVSKALRVLSLDGGGMRGAYAASYLAALAEAFRRKRGSEPLDIGAAFDLIVGTSTGAVVACALVANIPLSQVVELYRRNGKAIFPRKLPHGPSWRLVWDLARRPKSLKAGTKALSIALRKCFGDLTLREVYEQRGIALTIPAVEIGRHRSWLFKTPHLGSSSNRRDDGYRLAEICLASTAAPVYRSLAALDHPDGVPGYYIFADGGLWANNPVLVALTEALRMSRSGEPIQIFCLGTCAKPAGAVLDRHDLNLGLAQWKFGGEVANLTINVQEFAYDKVAKILARHLDRPCEVLRFPCGPVPASLLPYLDLDETRAEATDALISHARSDADTAHSRCCDSLDREGQLISSLFLEMPQRSGISDEVNAVKEKINV